MQSSKDASFLAGYAASDSLDSSGNAAEPTLTRALSQVSRQVSGQSFDRYLDRYSVITGAAAAASAGMVLPLMADAAIAAPETNGVPISTAATAVAVVSNTVALSQGEGISPQIAAIDRRPLAEGRQPIRRLR